MEAAEPTRLTAIASVLSYVWGIGMALGSLPLLVPMIRNREFVESRGIKFYSGGFIERMGGINAVILSVVAVIVVTLLNVLVGYWLGKSLRLGALLVLALFPIEMFFWVGLAAPIPILVVPVRLALVIIGWKSLV